MKEFGGGAISYADDVVIFYSYNTIEKCVETMNKVIERIQESLVERKLEISEGLPYDQSLDFYEKENCCRSSDFLGW